MKRKLAAGILLLSLLWGCGQESAPPPETLAERENPPLLEPAEEPFLVGEAEVNKALLEELYGRRSVSWRDGTDAPGGLEEFVEACPDFLLDCSVYLSGRELSCKGERVSRLLPYGDFTPEDSLLNRERMARFMENLQNGRPDRIGIISFGDPLPLWLKVLDYPGEGGELVLHDLKLLQEMEHVSRPAEWEQTQKEWIFWGKDGEAWWYYPRYGYQPLVLRERGEVLSPQEAEQAMQEFCSCWYPGQDVSLQEWEGSDEGGEAYHFLTRTEEGMEEFWILEKDGSRLYQIEMVNGKRVLLALPREKPSAEEQE